MLVLPASKSVRSVSSVPSEEKESPGLSILVISPASVTLLLRPSPKLPMEVKLEGECDPGGPKLSKKFPCPTSTLNEATCVGSWDEGEWALLRKCAGLKSSILLLPRTGDCGPGLGVPAITLRGIYIIEATGGLGMGLWTRVWFIFTVKFPGEGWKSGEIKSPPSAGDTGLGALGSEHPLAIQCKRELAGGLETTESRIMISRSCSSGVLLGSSIMGLSRWSLAEGSVGRLSLRRA
jgi:hypothetical protein